MIARTQGFPEFRRFLSTVEWRKGERRPFHGAGIPHCEAAMSTGIRTFSSPARPSHTTGWNIALWVSQALLAAMFAMAGGMKVFLPIHQLAQSAPFAAEAPEWLIRFIGACELA